MKKQGGQLYFAWIGFQRRQISMAPHCGFETVFLPVERRAGRIAKLRNYLRNSLAMMSMMLRQRPQAVWVQLPQVPLLWWALLYRALVRRDAVVVADCHNAMFRPPWSRVPLGLSLLSRCDVVLAHNADVAQSALDLGVDPERLMVVEDPPASFLGTGSFDPGAGVPRPWFVFPASFAKDEPIAELLEAARMQPGVTVLITGNVANCKDQELIRRAPANVRFVGFLSRQDFDALMIGCDAVIAFTRFDGIQLSVCGEAVGAGKPMLISNTATLRRLFPKGTVFVDTDRAEDIAAGFTQVLERREELAAEIDKFGTEMRDHWLQTRGRPLLRRLNLGPF
ncbi:glycosyltransferase family 4 protein [Noviherbaspirillum aridicola]|uniref:Glycosyl transferase family 1 domain-containing protein n=1 Tax=Noviherbaspirillum aridicola TaxID=2849687 RepID=A0ABQ4Q5P2_9BURK|nr:glycosyltransferase family 4 protein [Noviherbaspirillum aridicola]GIZ52518.1 hypothetical protein NCCP691_25320 [Noviherbaspirillum aridicola]